MFSSNIKKKLLLMLSKINRLLLILLRFVILNIMGCYGSEDILFIIYIVEIFCDKIKNDLFMRYNNM